MTDPRHGAPAQRQNSDPFATTTTLPAVDAELAADSPQPANGWSQGPVAAEQPQHAQPEAAPAVPAAPPRPSTAEPSTEEIRAAFAASAPPPPAPPVTVAPQPAQSAQAAGGQPASGAGGRSRRGSVGRPPRRAHLQLKRIDVWSVLKLACVLAFALFFVWLVIVGVLYGILDATGVFDKVNDTAHTINDNNKDVVTPGLVFGGALIIGVINVVLFIVLSTIGSVVYNLCSDLVGGVEVTLSERD